MARVEGVGGDCIRCLSFSFRLLCIGDVINVGDTPWFGKQPTLYQSLVYSWGRTKGLSRVPQTG